MASKMLIDAAHSEETRVVVVRGKRIEEFDYESATRRQLKGNIYLAKVTRVEPSLQAAFVDYGGNRHGFLAFSEIHPDYYQIPVADRQALLEEEEEDVRRSEEDYEARAESGGRKKRSRRRKKSDDDVAEAEASEAEVSEDTPADETAEAAQDQQEASESDDDDDTDDDNGDDSQDDDSFDSVGAEDALEEVPQRQRRQRRNYKIQEVIKRRQVILVQVVKEERGNKGAALTTYLSLAGRYCVLMPNTARGGGISRKITDANDRRRLKEVAKDTKVQPGMGLIVRTAGAQRTKVEIKRDFDYLMRLWGSVRDLTLDSTAPALVYEEGSLIKRSIRDLYTKDVEEVLVEGEAAVKEAKGFMKMLMPSHARHVKQYKETQPLFSRYQVEGQLDGLFSSTVTLQSGGYMVINQTEALVAIDINSGKATREHNIEDTALKTNMEAAQEIARQLRLRDLAGLIVIDFIDMEEKRNNRSVERKMKEALKNDRARIQVGRISHFGLLEMSRQRLRQGMLENSSLTCPECGGRGLVRSVSSCALAILRSIEERLINHKPDNLVVKCDREVAFYILNDKRDHLLSLESAWGVSIYLEPSSEQKQADCSIEGTTERSPSGRKVKAESIKIDSAFDEADAGEGADTGETGRAETPDGGTEDGGRKRKRRRGRRGGRRSRERNTEEQAAQSGEDQPTPPEDVAKPEAGVEAAEQPAVEADAEAAADKPVKKPRKRTRKPKAEAAEAKEESVSEEAAPETGDAAATEVAEVALEASDAETAEKPAKPKRARKPRKTAKAKAAEAAEAAAADADIAAEPADTKSNGASDVSQQEPPQSNGDGTETEVEARKWTPPTPTADPNAPRKSGWWSKK